MTVCSTWDKVKMTPTNSMELMKRKRVKCLKRYKYDYFTQIRPLAAAVSCKQHLSRLHPTSNMSLFAHLGASAAEFTPYVPFLWRDKKDWHPSKFISSSSSTTSLAAAGAPAGAAAATASQPAPNSYITYPSPPQPLGRNQRRGRNKAARNSMPQPPPPPPPPAPIYQPAAFTEDYLPGYLQQWMNQYNPYLARNLDRRAVSNGFNYDGDAERWLRERGWGWTAPLA